MAKKLHPELVKQNYKKKSPYFEKSCEKCHFFWSAKFQKNGCLQRFFVIPTTQPPQAVIEGVSKNGVCDYFLKDKFYGKEADASRK
jgi:hypothetical protein